MDRKNVSLLLYSALLTSTSTFALKIKRGDFPPPAFCADASVTAGRYFRQSHFSLHLPSAQLQLLFVQHPPPQEHLPFEQQSAFAQAQVDFAQQLSTAA